jgi:hypothetical protein
MEPTPIATSAEAASTPRPTLKQRLVSQFREIFGMFLYLWVLFALFTYHKAIVLAQYNIDYKPFGVAIINAFILAKVMLVAEKMNLAAKLRNKPLAYPILTKATVLALIFILFNLAETMLKGLWKGKALSESMPKIGGGSPAEFIITGAILAVALIPFFAFRELSLVLGRGVLGGLLMRGSREIALTKVDAR